MQSKITLMSIFMLLTLGALGALFFRFNPFNSSGGQNTFITLGLSFGVVVFAGIILIRPALLHDKPKPQTNQNVFPPGAIASGVQAKIPAPPVRTLAEKTNTNTAPTSPRKPLVSSSVPMNEARSNALSLTGPMRSVNSAEVSVTGEASTNRQILQQDRSPREIRSATQKENPNSPKVDELRNLSGPQCSFCGRVALPIANFCYSCGSPLNQLRANHLIGPQSKSVSNASDQNPGSQNLYFEEIRRLRESSERFEKLADRFTKLGYLLAAEAGAVVLIVILVFG